jgi:predicted RNase H-like HicB family nuclease
MGALLCPAVIERTKAEFAVFFPGLACGGAGDTMAEAVADAEQGLAAYLEAARESGIEVPPPAEIDKIKVERGIDDVARVLVRYEPPAHAVRINITMDEALLKRVDAAAEREGYTRSGFLAHAARRSLAEDARAYGVAGAKKGASRDAGTGAFIPLRGPGGRRHRGKK